MKRKARLGGSDFYKAAGLRQVIVHVSEKAHEALSSVARSEQRSLQKVAQAILERAARDPGRTIGVVNDFIRESSKPK